MKTIFARTFLLGLFSVLTLLSNLSFASPLFSEVMRIEALSKTQKNDIGINDPKANQTVKKAQEWLQSYKSLRIKFSYTVSQSGKTSHKGEGSLLVSGTSYKMDIGGQTFYCNGSTLYIYQPEIKEVSIDTYDKTKDELNPLMWLNNYQTKFRAKYIRVENSAGISQELIDLIPLVSSSVQKIRLYVEQNTHKPTKFELYDKSNQLYVYRITEFAPNIPIKSTDFTFDTKAHPGVLVNDMR